MKFRELKADEVELRIGSISREGKGLSLLLYKNARCDMNILDETIGSESWQREHYECKGNLFCRVGIRDKNTGEWVYKSDCGTESNTEKEKGEASDSFKRACTNWGIGRELYTSPFVWIKAEDAGLKESSGKWATKDVFSVTEIKISDDKKIVGLAVRNDKQKKIVYRWGECVHENAGLDIPVKCIKCGKEIEDVTLKTGEIISGREFASNYGGKCPDCIKAEKGKSVKV